MSYERTIKLKDNEAPVILNKDTGEIKEIRTIFNSMPEGKEHWMKNEKFVKMFSYSWKYLTMRLNSDELKVLVIMTLMVEPGTNALTPLNDEVSMLQLQSVFGIERRKMPNILKKLFDIGVYAKFEVSKITEGYKKYWILNPYVSFKGRLIDSEIIKLFYDTEVESAYAKQYFKEKRSNEVVGVEKERALITC